MTDTRPPGKWPTSGSWTAERVPNPWTSGRIADKHEQARRATAKLQQHREGIATYEIPTLRIPDPQTRLNFRGVCPYGVCGGTLFDVDIPSDDPDILTLLVHGSVVCGMCGRTVANLVIGTKPTLPVSEPDPQRGRPKRERPPKRVPGGW